MFGAGVAAVKIVVGNDHVGRERQTPVGHRLETARSFFRWPSPAAGVGPEVGVVKVGGGNEKRADDAIAFQFVGGQDNGWDADRMRDDDHRLRGAAREFRHAVAPGFDFWIFPVLLDDAPSGPEISFPAALPVIGAGVLPAGNNENVDFRCLHGCICLTDGADGGKSGRETGYGPMSDASAFPGRRLPPPRSPFQLAFGFADFLVLVSCSPLGAAKLVLENQALGEARVANIDRYR